MGTIGARTTTQRKLRDAPPTQHASLALAALCLGFFMVLLDGSALNIALPSIQSEIGASMGALQWLVNIYTIPLAALLLSAGTFADRWGARRVFIISLAGFTAASLACALAPGLGALVVFRFVQGVFAAGVLPTTLAIIARTYPDPVERAKAITVWGAVGGIALVAGPLGGGVLTEAFGWRSIFVINVPIGLLALALTVWAVAETDRRLDGGFDWLGQAFAIGGLALLVAGLIEAGERGWDDVLTILLLVAAVAVLGAFVVVERRVSAPVLPLGMFGVPAFTASIVNGFAFQFGAYGLQFMLALFVQRQWDFDPRTTGLFFLPFAVLWTFATLVLNRLWSGRGMRWLLVTGATIAFVGALVCLAAAGPDSWPILLAGSAVVGFGCGLFGPSCNGAAMASADRRYAGLASGVLNTSRQVGMAIGVAVLGVCLALADPVTGMRLGIILTAVAFGAIVFLSYRYVPSRQ
ncbi:MFS transporter [Rhodococcus sp. 1R11]|uniref:MFS transporter n=1 Tax=Rhodococcus sp. 1R11 TaxID=2559614 RepID=UPI0010717BAC|nr:MFS transporter [Rhodococcus sp. 1R11]TFI43676.1 MFS transporter [Rhodococcus sp. 1R11]